MKSTNNNRNGRNGHKTLVLEPELVKDMETLEAVTADKTAYEETVVLTPSEAENQETVPQPPESPKQKKPMGLILAALGVGAISWVQLALRDRSKWF